MQSRHHLVFTSALVLSLFVLLSGSFVGILASPPTTSCRYRSPAGHVYDYSSADTNDGKAWTAQDPSGNTFLWHVCSEVTDLNGCYASAVCQRPASGDPKSCGKLDTQRWFVVGNDDGSGATIQYSDGTLCQGMRARQTTLTLRCGDQPAHLVGAVQEDPSTPCAYLITMSGEDFCAEGSHPPASGCYLSTPAGYSYNLTAVNTNGTMPWSASDPLGNQYLWQLCTALTRPQPCQGSAVCQLSPGGSDYSCGLLSSVSWAPLNGVDNGLGLSGTYNGGTVCARGMARRSTNIELVCAWHTDVEVSVTENSTQPCEYKITMSGTAFCGVAQ